MHPYYKIFVIVYLILTASITTYATVVVYSFIKRWEVPYTPTYRRAQKVLRKKLELNCTDHVLDLGSGFGAMLVFFSQYPVTVTGVERQRWFCIISRVRLALHFFKKGKVTVVNSDFYSVPFESYTVIYAFLLPSAISKLVLRLQEEMQPGALLISYKFPFPLSEGYVWKKIEQNEEVFYLYRKR